MSSKLTLALIASFLCLGIVWGCGSGARQEAISIDPDSALTATASADVVIVEVGPPRLTTVQPVPARVLLSPGESVGLNALAFDQNGRELQGSSISWQVVDSQAGTITPRGVFRASFELGTFSDAVVVTARSPGSDGPGLVQGAVTVIVEELHKELLPVGVRLFPRNAEVEPSESLRLVALAVDANGVSIPNQRFQWEILEPLAGSISQDGVLTASGNVGTFPGAVQVTLVPPEGQAAPPIGALLDVMVVDPASLSRRFSASLLPQVISLRPGDDFTFTTLVLDRRGNTVTTTDPTWEVVDSNAGSISQDGRFTAGREPGVYSDTVRVTMTAPAIEEPIVASATVVIFVT